jgi:Zn-dependent protease with chaperone function/Flp pilus assembly protein TadD
LFDRARIWFLELHKKREFYNLQATIFSQGRIKGVKMGRGNKFFLVLGILFFFLLAGCASPAQETATPQPTRDPNLEKTIEQQLETINPSAVPIYRQATTLLDAQDFTKSKLLYQQVITLAPNFAPAYRRLGYIELDLNNIPGAEELSRKALDLEPDAYNQGALARVLLEKNTPKDSQDAYNLTLSAAKSMPNDEDINMELTWAALQIDKTETANQADQRLLQINPHSPIGHYFAGLLAANAGKWEQAENELLYAQKLGMPAQAIQAAMDEGVRRNALIFKLLRWGIIALIVWLLGFGGLFLAGTLLSRATLQALNTGVLGPDSQIKPEERRIRSAYRAVISVLSAYFYISIPFVVMLLLMVVGGAFYIILLIGFIPIQLSLVLVLMLIGSLFALLRALFSRVKETPPGHALLRRDAPELWLMVEDVAKRLNIRPMDAIYVTPWVDIAVNEKGSLLQKMRGSGQRNLMLGMGVLPGLTQGQFAAILAHEYGHFSNRDTAGGDLAHQAYTSLDQLAKQLIRSGAARYYNPVWLFVMGYQRIFLRVTLGASRLQEMLADRYAAGAFGSTNFIEGLQNTVRRTIEFQLGANLELKKSFELKQPVNNLYNLPAQPELQSETDKQIADIMRHTTKAYDSHPAIKERIDLVERMQIPYSVHLENNRPALELLPKADELQHEMTIKLLQTLKK